MNTHAHAQIGIWCYLLGSAGKANKIAGISGTSGAVRFLQHSGSCLGLTRKQGKRDKYLITTEAITHTFIQYIFDAVHKVSVYSYTCEFPHEHADVSATKQYVKSLKCPNTQY